MCRVSSDAPLISNPRRCLPADPKCRQADFKCSGDSLGTKGQDSFLVKPKDMSVFAFLPLSGVAAPSALRLAPLSSKPSAVSSLANASAETLPPVACIT